MTESPLVGTRLSIVDFSLAKSFGIGGLMKNRIVWHMLIMVMAFYPTLAVSSGFYVARFGGSHGHGATDNVTAIYYNPAGLALGADTRLHVEGILLGASSVTIVRRNRFQSLLVPMNLGREPRMSLSTVRAMQRHMSESW